MTSPKMTNEEKQPPHYLKYPPVDYPQWTFRRRRSQSVIPKPPELSTYTQIMFRRRRTRTTNTNIAVDDSSTVTSHLPPDEPPRSQPNHNPPSASSARRPNITVLDRSRHGSQFRVRPPEATYASVALFTLFTASIAALFVYALWFLEKIKQSPGIRHRSTPNDGEA